MSACTLSIRRLSWGLLAGVVFVSSAARAPGNDSEVVSFSKDIRPILSNNCFQCHGPDENERQADLRFDVTPTGGMSSEMLAELVRRINSDDPDEIMPPPDTKKRLTREHKQTIALWVASGAKWESHWAFQPVRRPRIPRTALTDPRCNPIDAFVLAKLKPNNISPAEPASPTTLIRRVYLDVLGVLPAPEQVDQFATDALPNAYEKMVDRVLADPRFGERWGRHWLDQARYADSDGYSIDGPRAMWPYRDWVIASINADMPFDQFTIEQLAGDLLPSPSLDQLIATGFHRNTLVNQEGGSDPEQFRNETVVDRTNTTGTVWLGLTVGCAQCHAHKFDPISHQEYYRLFAFFNSGEDKNSHDPRILAAPKEVREELGTLRSELAKTRDQLKLLKQSKSDTTQVTALQKRLSGRIAELETRYGRAMVMRDLDEPRETYVHIRGDFLRHGQQVLPNVPEVLGAMPASSPKNRLELARWLVDDTNPLTARVAVNRMWMRYFGQGIVATENDFGLQGTSPTHPELLDWLAAEMVHGRWSLKAIHRLILTSATYRQSSKPRAELTAVDANNVWLARQSRLRVTAEVVRDLTLSAAGILTNRIGGPSVYPPQPDGVYAFTQNRKSWVASSGANRYRRGMYTFFYRSAAHPFLTTFDTPNFQTTCTRRLRSNTPLQALTLANDQSVIESAREMARLALECCGTSDRGMGEDRQRMTFLFRRALSRYPSARESDRLLEFLNYQRESFATDLRAAGALTQSQQDAELAAWIATSRALLNLDEFVTRN